MDIIRRWEDVCRNIERAKTRSARTGNVTVIAVTKTHPPEIFETVRSLGIHDVGENYVQEMTQKIGLHPDLRWHFIGGLQRNKVKYIVGAVHMIHSIDNLGLAEEIEKRAAAKNITQAVLVQVNQGEGTKGGVRPEQAAQFVAELVRFTHLDVRGLMAMPPFPDVPEDSRKFFQEVRALRDTMNAGCCYRHELTELSMGMSADYAVAVEEGATMLRIGTALFGERGK